MLRDCPKSVALYLCISVVCASPIGAQTVDRDRAEASQRRVTARMQALQREADRLAEQSRTLLGELRTLEIERTLQAEKLQQTEADLAAAAGALDQTDRRIAALESRRVAQQPALQGTLVEVYKRGRAGYLRLLLGARDVRELGRATRVVSALARIDRQRVDEHRRTLGALRAQRIELERRNQQMTALRLEARQAQAARQKAIGAHAALIARIDSRRDLTAQLAGELQTAQQNLDQTLGAMASGRAADPAAVPLAPFRGDLDWPVTGGFTRSPRGSSARPRVAVAKNGIEIPVPEGTAVHAVHPGTVGFAEPFTGFGNLVVIDHGSNAYTVYGYLANLGVKRGDHVEAGDLVGQSGTAPDGAAAAYFEVRVDGQAADPVQWLKPR